MRIIQTTALNLNCGNDKRAPIRRELIIQFVQWVLVQVDGKACFANALRRPMRMHSL